MQISLRVTLGYHSIAQVCAGAGLGIGVAAVWHQLGQQYMFQFIDTSQHGETVLSAITWTAGVLFLVRVIAKGANTSLAATEPGTQE